jgi:two-component system, cell cycle sensor histidine kinase and response regulator CckA
MESSGDELNSEDIMDASFLEHLKNRSSNSISESYKSLLRTVIDTTPNLIFVKDVKGRFILCNSSLAKLYGTTSEAILGKTDSDFNPNQDEVDWYSKDDLYVISEQEEIFIPEERVTGPDGRIEWFETVKKPLKLPNGEICVLGVATNITRRRELFHQLSQSQKLEALGQLAGGVAHDMNNVLTAILGFASIIEPSAPNQDDLKKALKGIEKAVSGASRLTQKLLGFARKGKNINTKLDLNAVVTETLELLERTLEDNISFQQNLRAERAVILGDPIQIQQVVLNLAINARDSMMEKKGGTAGGTLSISSEDVVVHEPILEGAKNLQPGHYVKIVVKDTGCGIDEETLHRVFEPFFTTKPSEYGTGLGLAMVYGIVNNHGGLISISSSPGKGTVISLYFPSLSDPATARTRVISNGTNIRHGEGRILLVDDNKEIIDGVSLMLKHLGYTTLTSANREDALAIFSRAKDSFELVIMDMMMPGMDALTAIHKMRADNPDIGIIISTGYAKNDSVQKILSLSNTAFLQKPYRLENLSTMVNSFFHPEEACLPKAP